MSAPAPEPVVAPADLHVELLEVRFARAVDRYVLEHSLGTPFHETRWMDLVRSAFGFEMMTLVAWGPAGIVGVLPMALVAAPITGRRLVSVPFGVYGGILADDAAGVAALDDAAGRLARELGVRYVETRYLGKGPTDHESVTLYHTYRCELPEDPGEVLGRIPRKARAEVRKARQRFGLELIEGRHLLDDFYRLYCVNKRSLGSPIFRASFFTRLLDLYGLRALVHGIVQDGEVLGAVISLASGGVLYPYYSGAVPQAGRLGVNNAMYAGLMEVAVERGLHTFDFGRSRSGSGAAAFKQHMGFEPTPLDYQFDFPAGGHPPSITPSNPRMRVPQLVLSHLPMWVARLLGHSVMRHVP